MIQQNYYSPYSNNQQIPVANGIQSIRNMKMQPNCSCLIADSTDPVIYKCVSDSLGNVTTQIFDISPHKSEEEIKQDRIEATLNEISQRLERLEHESNTQRAFEQTTTEFFSA